MRFEVTVRPEGWCGECRQTFGLALGAVETEGGGPAVALFLPRHRQPDLEVGPGAECPGSGRLPQRMRMRLT